MKVPSVPASTKRTSLGSGLYQDAAGRLWARPWINKRRTWRKLKAETRRAGIKELHSTDFKEASARFESVADQYLQLSCPNRRLEGRAEPFCKVEKTRIKKLKQFFGHYQAESISIPQCLKYRDWRTKLVKRGSFTGERTVDLDLVTLSNVLSFAVATGIISQNLVRSGRPRFRPQVKVRHCRDYAPASGDEVHRLAEYFFRSPRSESIGWQVLFAALTGCRTSELLRMRMDAADQDQPGFIAGNYLFLRRSKGGVNPYALIHSDLQAMIDSFRCWHQERYPGNGSPWFFPGREPRQPLSSLALTHALVGACGALGISHRTAHGMRSFYVTKRRSDGMTDLMIAGEIGDTTVSLMNQTYGNRPPNWVGGKAMTWLPSESLPAWSHWKPK